MHCCCLKSHLFSLSYPAFWLFSHLYSVRTVTRSFWTLKSLLHYIYYITSKGDPLIFRPSLHLWSQDSSLSQQTPQLSPASDCHWFPAAYAKFAPVLLEGIQACNNIMPHSHMLRNPQLSLAANCHWLQTVSGSSSVTESSSHRKKY